ncbi:hypothetical protein BDZ97DRAFT_1844041 [Flammula alnicola]|nr:hypothetical protein BDZ97DRAFT_1844041 [Flammula alnicola]
MLPVRAGLDVGGSLVLHIRSGTSHIPSPLPLAGDVEHDRTSCWSVHPPRGLPDYCLRPLAPYLLRRPRARTSPTRPPQPPSRLLSSHNEHERASCSFLRRPAAFKSTVSVCTPPVPSRARNKRRARRHSRLHRARSYPAHPFHCLPPTTRLSPFRRPPRSFQVPCPLSPPIYPVPGHREHEQVSCWFAQASRGRMPPPFSIFKCLAARLRPRQVRMSFVLVRAASPRSISKPLATHSPRLAPRLLRQWLPRSTNECHACSCRHSATSTTATSVLPTSPATSRANELRAFSCTCLTSSVLRTLPASSCTNEVRTRSCTCPAFSTTVAFLRTLLAGSLMNEHEARSPNSAIRASASP